MVDGKLWLSASRHARPFPCLLPSSSLLAGSVDLDQRQSGAAGYRNDIVLPRITPAQGCTAEEADGLATGLPNGPRPRPFRFQGNCAAGASEMAPERERGDQPLGSRSIKPRAAFTSPVSSSSKRR
jgi:hypothetical protein